MSAQRVAPSGWLHDDTEEDLVGTDWHQRAIRTLSESLEDLAFERQLPWHVGDQLTLVASLPDGTVWRPSPDITLHPHAGPAKRADMSTSVDGVPALIIEVASPSTWEYDVETRHGKAWGYMQLGVPNYLVFDPQGALWGQQCRGWQRHGARVREWRRGAHGRYHARGLELAFAPEGDLLRVFDAQGRPVAFTHESRQQARTQAQQMQTQAQRIADLEAELARLRGTHGGGSS